jgi:hypothetical protein
MLKMETADKKISKKALSEGSALILTVVLTSLLAIVGVLFVMVSRVDRMATSSISDNKELNFTVETIIAQISQELTLDVPGVAGQEYYDYPDVNDIWLASLEPYSDGTFYRWRQISDLYAKWDPNIGLQAEVVPDYQEISEGLAADADGDGVADSRWVIIPDVNSSKDKPIYAAVRIIDNEAMLNANTGFKFTPFLDPNNPQINMLDIAGPGQLQINLMALAGLPGMLPTGTEEMNLLTERANSSYGLNPLDLTRYDKNVIWSYEEPKGPYTPFDISDELELHYRFLLNHRDIDTRLEQWGGQFRLNTLSTPLTSGGGPLDMWFDRLNLNSITDPNYSYRHIATTYNMDRIIDPDGRKMVNVNIADVNELYTAIREGLLNKDPNVVGAEQLAAQLAVNIVDLRDADAQVSFLPVGPKTYFGFEAQPFISELGFRISSSRADISANNYFAIELYNPFDTDILLGNFRLEIRDPNRPISDDPVYTISLNGYGISDGSRFVITNGSAASRAFGVSSIISTGGGKEDTNLVLATYVSVPDSDPPTFVLNKRYDVYLIRHTTAGDIYLDKQQTQDSWFDWDTVNDVQQFYARADNNWNEVYQSVEAASNTLSEANGLNGERKNYNFYIFANAEARFASVGDIARAFIVGPSTDPGDMIGVKLDAEPAEDVVRLNLQNPVFANIFQYLTVIDPTEHIDPPNPPDPNDYPDNQSYQIAYRLYLTNYQIYSNETRIKGRININTAPWFVIAQLPWMQPAIAQAVTFYRDTIMGAFQSIGELVQVPEMGYYAYDPNYAAIDLNSYPDMTYSDGAISDFEERDVIFSRISNIVTVRSDVFTAYILVRIGANGPQKRVLAVLDRSQVTSPYDKVRILALHPVPDPR